jgi:hypothetical protein
VINQQSDLLNILPKGVQSHNVKATCRAACQELKLLSTSFECATMETQKVYVNTHPYLTNNRHITNSVYKHFIDVFSLHAISSFVSVTMGLEIPISSRKTVAEEEAYTERFYFEHS